MTFVIIDTIEKGQTTAIPPAVFLKSKKDMDEYDRRQRQEFDRVFEFRPIRTLVRLVQSLA